MSILTNEEIKMLQAALGETADNLTTDGLKKSLALHVKLSSMLQIHSDWAKVLVCPDCKFDYDINQVMCISCGKLSNE